MHHGCLSSRPACKQAPKQRKRRTPRPSPEVLAWVVLAHYVEKSSCSATLMIAATAKSGPIAADQVESGEREQSIMLYNSLAFGSRQLAMAKNATAYFWSAPRPAHPASSSPWHYTKSLTGTGNGTKQPFLCCDYRPQLHH